MLVQLKKKFYLPLIALLSMTFFFSCQKEIKDTLPTEPTNEIPDLSTRVNSSVSGFVTDENNVAVQGASVVVGSRNTATDEYGYFEIRNVEVVKTAAVVTVTQPGYFKGIKTYIATADRSAFFRIKLIPKTNTGNIDGTTGGSVTLTNGLVVALPANAAVIASSNAAYSGQIMVASYWIDPTAVDLNQIMPGDLRGLDEAGGLKGLTTYGMAAVELTSASGELLQIATGKKATLTMPVPAAILSNAPSSIPLWSFNETNGLWKQEGSAVKTGNTYVGEVSHFSFWNCDVPANYVQFNCTVVDAAGNPIPFVPVKISVVATPNNAAWGYTDSSGYVAGAIPGNAALLLEIFTSYGCGTAIHSQNFTTSGANVSLGNITVNATSSIATITGSVTDCASAPVSDGYIIMNHNSQLFRYSLSNTGTFNFNTLLCTGSSAAIFIAEDNVALQQSTPLSYNLVAGANAIGNLQACGVSTAQFITYSLDGGVTTITYASPADSLFQDGNGTTGFSYISANNNASGFVNFSMDNTGIGVGSIQNLTNFYDNTLGTQTTVSMPNNVINITEYGPVGGYIAGNFSATLTSTAPPATYPLTCSFRVRRNF